MCEGVLGDEENLGVDGQDDGGHDLQSERKGVQRLAAAQLCDIPPSSYGRELVPSAVIAI
jgi:hypothetical protein